MDTEQIRQLIKKYGYSISIVDRPTGLVTLTLTYGADYDYKKEFSEKSDYHFLLVKALLWVLDQQQTDNTVYYLKQIITDDISLV